MHILPWIDNNDIIAGITLKDQNAFEAGNLAFHTTNHPEKTLNNRQTFANSLGVSLDQLTVATQTHSDNIFKVTRQDQGRGAFSQKTAIPHTDALYTTEPGILLGTFTADCVPILFYDNVRRLVGVIHSGWQGTVKEITRKTIQHLVDIEQCNPKHLNIHLGPSISQEKFEVDSDVYEQFLQLGYADTYMYFNQQTNKYHIDTQKIVKHQCEMSGVPAANISRDFTCTFKSKAHFSYREDKQTDRHLSFIMMRN